MQSHVGKRDRGFSFVSQSGRGHGAIAARMPGFLSSCARARPAADSGPRLLSAYQMGRAESGTRLMLLTRFGLEIGEVSLFPPYFPQHTIW